MRGRPRGRTQCHHLTSGASAIQRLGMTRLGDAIASAAMTATAPDPAIQNKLFINGDFVDARSGETFATINPATEETITDIASAGAEDVDAAVKAARAQMEPGSEWQKMKPRDRAKVMWRLADLLTTRAAEIGRIETIDNG